jgi:hypothetical protein
VIQVYPCSISVSVYHLFQLTELSSVFLHLAWMRSKANAPYRWLHTVSVLLGLTFTQRVLTSAYILVHTAVKVRSLELWLKLHSVQPSQALLAPHCLRAARPCHSVCCSIVLSCCGQAMTVSPLAWSYRDFNKLCLIGGHMLAGAAAARQGCVHVAIHCIHAWRLCGHADPEHIMVGTTRGKEAANGCTRAESLATYTRLQPRSQS